MNEKIQASIEQHVEVILNQCAKKTEINQHLFKSILGSISELAIYQNSGHDLEKEKQFLISLIQKL